MVMRWGSANVLTLHETVDLLLFVKKVCRPQRDVLIWRHSSMHRGIASLGCKKQDADVKETGKDDIII